MKFFLQKKVFSLKDSLEVKNEEGKIIYSTVGTGITLGNRIVIKDYNGKDRAVVEERPMSAAFKYDIYLKDSPVITVVEKGTLQEQSYGVEGTDVVVKGDFSGSNFDIFDGEKLICKITSKKKFGHDHYEISLFKEEKELEIISVILTIYCINSEDIFKDLHD